MSVRPSLLAALLAIGFSSIAPAQADMSIEVSLKNRYLTLFENGKVIGKYPIAIGPLNLQRFQDNLISREKMHRLFTTKKERLLRQDPTTLWAFDTCPM